MAFLKPRDASQFLAEARGVYRTPQTLAKYRVHGGGPRYRKVGANVVYEESELIAWADGLMSAPRNSTSEAR